jgi:hypothetical protein
VFGSDDKNFGHLVEINRAPDGNVPGYRVSSDAFWALAAKNADSFNTA